MDYDSLYKILPKDPRKWQVQDVVVWLKFIGLEKFEERFVNLSIDGSVLFDINQEDIENELQIGKGLTQKKLNNWLQVGLNEYSKYLATISTVKIQNFQNIDYDQSFTIQKSQSSIGNLQLLDINQDDQQLNASIKKEDKEKPQFQQIQNPQPVMEHQLILQPLEGQQNNFYCIKESGAKIGRHSSNQILILEENISRYHAEVVFQDGRFAIRDIGSTTGTYIKILKSLTLEKDMLIELGSNLFQIQNIEEIKDGEIKVHMLIVEGPNQDDILQPIILSQAKTSLTLGRKSTVDIPFTEDHHLSNQHAKFYLIDNKVTLEDHSSTNGSWLRLSPEGQNSQLYYFDQLEQMVIRIGTTNQYICQQNKINIMNENAEHNCIICCERERDSLYLPCKHNATCLKCSKNLQQCPICRNKIQEQIRIFKN
ncbi:hypothetical protein pb186bvf_018863 [Paramecium bursaria]